LSNRRDRDGGQRGLVTRTGPSADGLAEGARDAASGVRDALSNAASSVGDGVSSVRDGAARASQKISQTTRVARDRAHHLGDAARHGAERARSGFERLVHEQPLALGAVGIAIGALLAASAPRTRQEDDLMGDASDRLKDGALQAGEHELDRATAAFDAAWPRRSPPEARWRSNRCPRTA